MSDKPKIDALEAAQSSPNAMVNARGDVFYPDDGTEAAWFAIEHGARPLSPDRFPFTPDPLTVKYLWPALKSLDVDDATQYRLEWEQQ